MRVAVWITFVLAMVWAAAAPAQEAVFNKPLYDPASKSYFELVRLTKAEESKRYIPSMNWAEANEFASKRTFKGAKGRLAIIKSPETHTFILMNLRPADRTWIGLRYFCKNRKLEWVDGKTFKAGDFKAWAPDWDRSGGVGCQERGYMPVAYLPVSAGFRWFAIGGLKLYRDLLVEYPTGKP